MSVAEKSVNRRRKAPNIHKSIYKKVKEATEAKGKNTVIKTWKRDTVIAPFMIGSNIHVHNGKKFIPVFITKEMIGHKLGEFSPTRTYYGHGEDKKNKKA